MSAVQKLVCGAFAVVALSLVTGVSGWLMVEWLGTELDRTVNQITRQQMLAGQISTSSADMMAQARGLAFATVLQQSADARMAQQGYQAAAANLRGQLDAYQKLVGAAQVATLTAKSRASQASYENLVRKLGENKMDEALGMLNAELLPSLNEVGANAKQLVESQNRVLADVRARSATARSRGTLVNAALFIACLVIGSLVIVTVRSVQRQLSATVTALAQEAAQLAQAAAHVSASNQQLADMVTTHGSAIETASAHTSEIRNDTHRNAENARAAAEHTEGSYRKIQEANTALQDMLNAMNEIGGSSKKISGVIKVIDGIAFQTNILSLNASVEAARAGAAGLGFAVVADEVRGLAQRSASAARDTSTLIEDSLQKARLGNDKASDMARSIASVTETAHTVKGLVDDVRASCQNSDTRIAGIVSSVESLRQLAHTLTASAEEGLAAGQQLSGQAQGVNQIVTSLEQLVGKAS